MLCCDWCKQESDTLRKCHIVFAVHGHILKDHEFLSHDWEFCDSCMKKAHGIFSGVVEDIKKEAPGQKVTRPPNPRLPKWLPVQMLSEQKTPES